MILRSILGILLAAALGLSGCRAVRLSTSIAGEGICTACKVTGHALGAAFSAVCLEPKGVVKHTFGAAGDAIDGAADAAGAVVCEAIDIID